MTVSRRFRDGFVPLNSKVTGPGPAVSLAVSPIFLIFFALRVAQNIFRQKYFSKICSRAKKCRKEWPSGIRLFVWVIYRMAAYQTMCFSLLGCWGNKKVNYPCDISTNIHNKRRRSCTLLFVTHVVGAHTQNIVYLSV